jgi:hypothetical protein
MFFILIEWEIMLTRNNILSSLQFLANEYVDLSIAWHVLVVFVLVLAIYNKKLSGKLSYGICGFLFLSVSLMAAVVINPFNFVIFLALAFVFLRKSVFQSHSELYLRRQTFNEASAYILILSGLVYPHFLSGNVLLYLIAAPIGIIPCPTLLVTSGFMLLFSITHTKLHYVLIAVNVFYGVIGVFFLGVALDVMLILSAVIQYWHFYTKSVAPRAT